MICNSLKWVNKTKLINLIFGSALFFPARHLHSFVMDSSDDIGNLNHIVKAVALNDGPAPDGSVGQKETPPTDMLRFFFYICFLLLLHLHLWAYLIHLSSKISVQDSLFPSVSRSYKSTSSLFIITEITVFSE